MVTAIAEEQELSMQAEALEEESGVEEVVQEEPQSIQEQIDGLDDELQTLLEQAFDKMHSGISRERLDPSDYSPMFHQFVKLVRDQDKLMERADAEKLQEIVDGFALTIQDRAIMYWMEVSELLNQECVNMAVKFTEKDGKVTMDVTSILQAFPEILRVETVDDDSNPPTEGQMGF